ncbi:MAG: ABC transporter permease [Proteobacteria bacterium]|nr:ABC transporter permease [Pseudomonadota bacterium]
MDLMPILRTLRKHKTAATLIVLETAVACAVVANALHLVGERLRLLTRADGLPSADLLVVHAVPSGTQDDAQRRQITERDMAALRALPGVASASFVNQMPYANYNNFSGVSRDGGKDARNYHANMHAADASVFKTLGLTFTEGGPFADGPTPHMQDARDDFSLVPRGVVINTDLARALYPGESALGKPLYMVKPFTIIGVSDNLPMTHPQAKPEGQRYAALFQVRPSVGEGFHVLRVAPDTSAAARADLVQRVRRTLMAVDPQRELARVEWLDQMRRDYDASDRQMAWLMAAVTAVLLMVTTGGVVGLASFWVQQRTRMIGTRRALGATRGQVLRYFLAENALLTSMGLVLGMAGAYGLGLALMRHWEVAPLPAWYLPAGAAVLLALGQLAAWIPARQATRVSPVVALRG